MVALRALALLALAGGALAALDELRAFLQAAQHVPRSRYRPLYHVAAPAGWLLAPAAFVRYRRRYHLFYVHHGRGGAPAWGHAASADLARWAHHPPALAPRDALDRRGCLAGAAVPHRARLALFYTALEPRGNRTRASVAVAVSRDAVVFHKYLYNPVVRPPPALELRDPHVWRHRGRWRMLAAANAERPSLALYESPDLYAWRANGTLARSLGDMGSAWESPDLFELDGTCVLLLSAAGVRPDGDRFRGARQSGYVVASARRRDCGEARLAGLEVSTATFEELDRGHDFRAARTTRAADGRRLLVAWLGSWEGRFEEARDGWAGVLTLVRELRVGPRGRMLQTPVRELATLRVERMEDARYSPGEGFSAGARAFELLVNASSAAEDAELALEWGGRAEYVLRYWAARGAVSVRRGGDMRRADWSPTESPRWRVFVDRSSVEVFCGAGEAVFSSRIYPRGVLRVRVGGSAPLHITQYRLRRSVGYDDKLTQYLKEQYFNKNDDER